MLLRITSILAVRQTYHLPRSLCSPPQVLAAKQKAKASTPEGIAAAKAAAEEKKKLEKKKKDKKDKNAMGGGRKKKDVVAHVGHSSNF